jgi:2-polyprenyl-3-methyl-5-hydroxy-6-metoxy-1,4-benzoquinol methylase
MTVEKTKVLQCNLCGCDNLIPRLEITQPDRFEAYVLLKNGIKHTSRGWLVCRTCKVAVQDIADEMRAGLNAISSEYYEIDFGNIDLHARQQRILSLPEGISDNKCRVDRTVTILKSFRKLWALPSFRLKVLDFGSGLGVFPIVFGSELRSEKIDLDLHLVETDPRALRLLQEIPDVTVHAGSFNAVEHNNYHIIFMNKVLEHLGEPLQWISTLKKALVPNGLLYVEVPSLRCLDGETSSNELGSLHFNLYGREVFEFIAHRTSMKILECEEVNDPSGKLTCYCVLSNPGGINEGLPKTL